MSLSKEQIAELRRLENAATPAPWTDDRSAVLANGGDEIVDAFAACPQGAWNAQLIAAMRNALPELLDAAEELAALKEWKAGAEKTLLENAALLEKSAAMFLAAKDEAGKLRAVIRSFLDAHGKWSGELWDRISDEARALLEEAKP